MDRPYKYFTWNEIMKARDALQMLCDLGIYSESDCIAFDNINDEIHYRYERGTTKGGDLIHAGQANGR